MGAVPRPGGRPQAGGWALRTPRCWSSPRPAGHKLLHSRRWLMPSALEGIRVIDLAQHMAGPGTSMYLADQGADVVKIEPPGKGDSARRLGMTAYVRENSRVFMAFNRNKK